MFFYQVIVPYALLPSLLPFFKGITPFRQSVGEIMDGSAENFRNVIIIVSFRLFTSSSNSSFFFPVPREESF